MKQVLVWGTVWPLQVGAPDLLYALGLQTPLPVNRGACKIPLIIIK